MSHLGDRNPEARDKILAKTLSTFMVNDMPDWARFFEVVVGLSAEPLKQRKDGMPGLPCGEDVVLCYGRKAKWTQRSGLNNS